MEWATKLLGPTLRQPDGHAVPTSEALSGTQYVFIYVSAHWCGPCKKFTPLLGALYDEMVADAESKCSPNEVAVVFVSGDNDEDSFEDYHVEMPWHAVPWASEAREALLDAYGDKGIPRLVMLDSLTGTVVDPSARDRVVKRRTLVGLENSF